MLFIKTQDSYYSREEVAEHLSIAAQFIYNLQLDTRKPVGVVLDISYKSVILLLALIELGYKTALCPLREPALVINSWLTELGAESILSAQKLSFESCLTSYKINIFDIIKSYKPAQIINYSNFASIIRTSGTSSTPKSALLYKKSHIESAYSVCSYFDFNSQHTWLLSLPLYHVSGLSILFRALVAKAGVFIASGYDNLLASLKSKIISHVSVVPAQVKRLLQDELDLSFLSALIVGGDALGNQDRKEALARGWPLFETYGMCETASMVAVKKSSEAFTTILPHAEINFGEDGEIKVKASSLFAGYIADNKLDICLDNNNYFATGDISAPDKFNYLEISRKYNRIISGGENIQAEEIERVLEKNTNIESCVVIGIPDEKLGSRPVAFIKYNKIIADHEIYEFLARYLAPYKWPVRFINWPLDAPDGFKKPRRWFYERIIN